MITLKHIFCLRWVNRITKVGGFVKASLLSPKFLNRSHRTIFLQLILILTLLLPASSIQTAKASTSSYRIVIPMSMMEHWAGPPVLVGVYSDHWIGDPNTINTEFHGLDQWAGKKMSLAGVFSDIELPYYEPHVKNTLTLLWDNGYTPFVNLGSKRSATSIANGDFDSNIQAWAQSFKEYAQGGARMAFIAPLQEMNGWWVPYHQGPDSYKAAYRRIRSIFQSAGVPSQSIQWVFAPNGSSSVGDEFERYYPGDNEVDVVGFSAFNFGFCPEMPSPHYIKPDKLFPPFVNRMRIMAPTKPIFVAQTATTALTKSGWNDEAKNIWIKSAYTLLANEGVRGILYYNYDTNSSKGMCDLAFYKTWDQNQRRYTGYVEAVGYSAFRYQGPIDLLSFSVSP